MRQFRRLHEDRRGAISVLVLLTIWCLVALIAMIWNAVEYSARRQHIQSAADSAAHASATWMARSLNSIAAQNMVIARDASAEAIWRAAITTGGDPNNPLSGSIYTELNRELQDAQAGRSRIRGLAQRLQALSTRIEVEYEFTHTALQAISSDLQGSFPDQKSQDAYANTLRQAGSALAWVENTYVQGISSGVNGRPGPPGPGGEGLLQLVDKWSITPTTEQAIFQLIVNYINTVEMSILQNFQAQTEPATSLQVDVMMQKHERETVFQQQLDERDNTPKAIDDNRQNIQNFYNTKIMVATTKTPDDEPTASDQLGLAASGTVSAPVITDSEASDTSREDDYSPKPHTDLIRTSSRLIPFSGDPPLSYGEEAAQLNLPPSFDIDPVNPHTTAHVGVDGQQWEDATLWHPDIPIMTSDNKIFLVKCNIPGGWGHLWVMPIERYLNDRIWNDQSKLRQDYMVLLDAERNNDPARPDLKRQIWAMQDLPQNFDITTLPRTLVDDTANTQGGFDNIAVLPRLTPPPNASADFNSQVTLYNTHSQTYLSEVRQLRGLLLTFGSVYEEFYISFAVRYWDHAVNAARDTVMGANPNVPGLAQNGTFMTLATYKLRPIPSWAQDGMRNAVQEQVAEHIIEMNVVPLTQSIANGATGTAVRPYADEAMQLLQAVANDAATEIADEWINRPWPYEITPPSNPSDPDAPPTVVPIGISKTDRQNFFSVLALATDNNVPRLLLPKVFGNSSSLSAYAQAEAFNWMEFNANYGGSEEFNNTSNLPYGGLDGSNTFYGGIGCPRGWRLCSVGGWNWQARLSVSDNLANVAKLNPDIQAALNAIGIDTDSSDTQTPLDQINLH